jgi:hypothetical protein
MTGSKSALVSAGAVRRLVLLGVFALSALPYLYADTVLTIVKLPSVIVFAAASTAPYAR